MAEATTQINVTPKQLGKHLRAIRRKKGLSLAEVARGAGLSRRELVNYERGKEPIPESDLWVLAGSCGVDVSELMPTTSTMELTVAASSTSVGDTVSQLRRGQEDAGITAYLHTLQKLQALPAGKRIPVKERELDEIATALGSTPRSIEQKLQEVLHVSPDEAERLRAMILLPPNGRGRPRALAAAPSVLAAAAAREAAPAPVFPAPAPTPFAAVPTPTPFAADVVAPVAPFAAAAPVAPAPAEPVQPFPVAPPAFLDHPLDAPVDALAGHNVDVFEELARLPEPLPLGDPSAPLPDLLAPQDPFAAPFAGVPAIGPPDGAVELVDSAMPAAASAGGAAAWNAAEAPPIDVAMRQGSATWDLGEPPLVAKSTPTPDATTWETDGWQPPAPEGTEVTGSGFWEGTDEWAPTPDTSCAVETGAVETGAFDTSTGAPMVLGEDTWAGAVWDPEPWTATEAPTADAADVNPWTTEEWPQEPADRGAWDHRPDPAAVDTGFYVDWGTPETEAPPGSDASTEPPADFAPGPEGAFATEATTTGDTFALFDGAATPFETETETAPDEPAPAWDFWPEPTDGAEPSTNGFEFHEPGDVTADEPEVAVEPAVEYVMEPVAELAPISWRADGSQRSEVAESTYASVVVDDVETAPEQVSLATPWIVDAPAANGCAEPQPEWVTPAATDIEPQPQPEPEPAPVVEQFVSAGPDWQLGNALPLVEVRGQGGLVMRRADERWALADITTTPDFVAEVEVDFRSGPGLGVLFRASTDEQGRMSGYSFDIDPIYDGGGYLVRQWQADRELWNPIARVSGDDPASMYGTLLVRIEVTGEHMSAQVNGVEVLTVENLEQASIERGRDAATGDHIGVQAWSSSDLVIDTARVAAR